MAGNRLERLAEQLGDAQEIDWSTTMSTLQDAGERREAEALRLVESVAKAHRVVSSSPPLPPVDEATVESSPAERIRIAPRVRGPRSGGLHPREGARRRKEWNGLRSQRSTRRSSRRAQGASTPTARSVDRRELTPSR